jgi:catechol 2,3-dioxygenase-like lactoylglutathione lyase family enzyme
LSVRHGTIGSMADPIAPNFSIVTLGVADLDRSVSFYRDLGWEMRGNRSDGIVWFRTAGSWIGLFGYDELADDAALPSTPQAGLPAYRGVTLAVNLPSEGEVDQGFARAEEVGARIVKPATRMEWGGYSGYFADPDGHLWELCYNPMFPIDDQGRVEIT